MRVMSRMFANLQKLEEQYTEGLITDSECIHAMLFQLENTTAGLIENYKKQVESAESSLHSLELQ